MTILVPIKRVVDPYARVKPTPDGSGIDVSGVKFDVNPFDEIACEEAVRIKEKFPDTKIIVLSIGAAECEEQLRKALAMGADKAVLVETQEALDSPAVAVELAAWVKRLAPDIVLMGKQATDDDCNQAAQMTAALLGWPQATFASKMAIDGGTVDVTRETDTGSETLRLTLPCVITTDLRLNEPRYIALPGIIKARTKPLERHQALEHRPPKTRVLAYRTSPARASGIRVQSVQELAAALKTKGVM